MHGRFERSPCTTTATPTLNVTSMSLNASASISWEPQSFSVVPGGQQDVRMYVNFGATSAGETTRRLNVYSNDPDESPYPNAVDLSVWLRPSAFNKVSPANGASGQSAGPTLSWGASGGAAGYEFCLDTTNDSLCANWTTVGSTSVALSGLTPSTTYYWQVRTFNQAGYAYGNNTTTFWTFTIASSAAPGGFGKTTPANGATELMNALMLSWNSSAGASSYEYCLDTSNDNSCTGWTSTGAATSPDSPGSSTAPRTTGMCEPTTAPG